MVSPRLVHVPVAVHEPAGRDGARREAVDADPLARVVGRHHLGELDQRSLRGAVRGALGRGHPAELGGDEDDAAASTPGERRQRGLAHEEGAGQVHRDRSIPVGLLHRHDRRTRLARGRAEEEDVEAAEHRLGGGDGSVRIRRPAHVEALRERPPSRLLHGRGRGAGSRLIHVGADHVAAGRAHDQRDLVFQDRFGRHGGDDRRPPAGGASRGGRGRIGAPRCSRGKPRTRSGGDHGTDDDRRVASRRDGLGGRGLRAGSRRPRGVVVGGTPERNPRAGGRRGPRGRRLSP